MLDISVIGLCALHSDLALSPSEQRTRSKLWRRGTSRQRRQSGWWRASWQHWCCLWETHFYNKKLSPSSPGWWRDLTCQCEERRCSSWWWSRPGARLCWAGGSEGRPDRSPCYCRAPAGPGGPSWTRSTGSAPSWPSRWTFSPSRPPGTSPPRTELSTDTVLLVVSY